jgi:hypothetical protein
VNGISRLYQNSIGMFKSDNSRDYSGRYFVQEKTMKDRNGQSATPLTRKPIHPAEVLERGPSTPDVRVGDHNNQRLILASKRFRAECAWKKVKIKFRVFKIKHGKVRKVGASCTFPWNGHLWRIFYLFHAKTINLFPDQIDRNTFRNRRYWGDSTGRS